MELDVRAAETLAAQVFGILPAEDDPVPIGPWGPILRDLPRVRGSGLALGPVPNPWILLALNPQPLPPLPALMARALLDRAETLADIGKALGAEAIAQDYVAALIDDLCPPPRRIPIPRPPKGEGDPPPRPEEIEITAGDLLQIGAALRSDAAWSAHPGLALALREHGGRAMGFAIQGFRRP